MRETAFRTRVHSWGRAYLLATVTCLAVLPGVAWAQCEFDVTLVDPSSGGSSDEAGCAVAASGDIVIVGARGDDDRGSGAGSAHVYTNNGSGWVEGQPLLALDGAADDHFGHSVSVSGGVVVVGSYGHAEAGAAYVFRYDGSIWVEEQKLTPSDGIAGDNFGYAVGVSGDVAVVGAYGVDDSGTSSGAAYMFRFDGSQWIEGQKLTASDGAAYDFFGVATAMSNDVAVIGAYLDDEGDANSGAAYVFRLDGSSWVEEQKLVASDAAADDRMGTSVAVSGNRVIVGAPQDDDQGSNSGSAYVYRWDSSRWVEETKLLLSDGAALDTFGTSVAVFGDLAAVGAHLTDFDGVTDSGSVSVFSFDGSKWVEAERLLAPDGWYGDYFGYSVALSEGVTAVGAVKDDNSGNNSGSAYIFEGQCPSSECESDGECDDGNPCTADVCADGVCVAMSAPDFDGNGSVGLADFEVFQVCLDPARSGDWEALCPCCDLNGDGPIDLNDFSQMQSAFNEVP
ncbi:MAG: FG-GAP repeat protein [Phycisphaerales bacterium]|nr:MAG: FG-GAP repeat protein [Phycisphaerales bacterium]